MKKFQKHIVFFLLIFFRMNGTAQTVYYQDVFHGEVSYIGLGTWDASGQITLPTNLANGTSIRKIFLICYGLKGAHYTPSFRRFAIDNLELQLDTLSPSEIIIGNNTFIPSGNDYDGHVTYIKDLTSFVGTVNSTITIDWIANDFLNPDDCTGCNISSPMLLILHDNPGFPAVNVSLVINEQNNDDHISILTDNFNAADFSSPIALGIHTDRVGANFTDGYGFKINNQDAGEIISIENSAFSFGLGAVGCFHYGNNIFTALTDDNIDSTFNGPFPACGYADGLIDAKSYLGTNIDSIQLEIDYTGLSDAINNIFVGYSLVYTTPCQPQNVSTIKDTLICNGEQLTLFATGAATYEWSPQKDLSCYSCASPIFTGDSSQLYTVRISANDSCSVVRPIMIHVQQPPQIDTIISNPTLCGASTGSIQFIPESANSIINYSLNNGANQSTGYFNNLGENSYLLSIEDSLGCVFDTSILVGSFKTVIADFSVSTYSGIAPLDITIQDQSLNADGTIWTINGSYQNNPFNGFQADSSGNYTVQLIVWQNDSTCTDTTYQIISVSSIPFYIIGSSLIQTHTGEQTEFLVHTNSNPMISIELYDLNGRIVKKKRNISLLPGSNTIWTQQEMSELHSEMCFYRITWKNGENSGELKGKVVIIR